MDTQSLIHSYGQELPASARGRFLLFPHAGGSPGSFQELARHLSPYAPVASVSYPGRAGSRDKRMLTDIKEFSDSVAFQLITWQQAGPTVLFGHSLGAVIAYEVACRLSCRQEIVLAVSAHPEPHQLKRSVFDDHPGDSEYGLAEQVAALDDDAREAMAYPILRDLFIPIIQADLAAHARYRPEPGDVLGCPIVALEGMADPVTTFADIHAWANRTRTEFRHHVLPGGHFYLKSHLPVVAEILAEWLPVADPPNTGPNLRPEN